MTGIIVTCRITTWCLVALWVPLSFLFVDFFFDGWNEKISCFREIFFFFCVVGKRASETVVILQIAYKDDTMSKNTSLRGVFIFYELSLVAWRPTWFCATVHLSIKWKYENLWINLGEPSPNNHRTCWYDWCISELLPTKGIATEKYCSKICASFAHGRLKTVSIECDSWIEKKTVGSWSGLFFRSSSLGTKADDTEFTYVEEVKVKTTEALKDITSQELQHCLEKRKMFLDRCIASNGESFEGDKSVNTYNFVNKMILKNSRVGVTRLYNI